MLLNEKTAILTPKILLVPYSEHHVPTYHEWMQDEALQKATASEPLTLDQEYAMQRSWRTDADKLTFIACTALLTTSPHDIQRVQPTTHDAPDRMIGDVNLFLCEAEDASDDEDAGSTPSKELPRNVIGEVEIMIARTDLHGSGYGKAILLTFLAYILSNLPALLVEYGKTLDAVGRGCSLRFLRVKIDGENARSIRLFESVGFRKMSEKVNYFGELELRWDVKGGEVEEPRGVEMRCLEYSTEYSKET